MRASGIDLIQCHDNRQMLPVQVRNDFLQDDYWEQSTQPFTSLCFVAPLLLLYEFGIVWIGPCAMGNGADVWLREFLARLGLAEFLFLPAITCGLMLGWHHLTRKDWKFRNAVVSGMVCESFLFGISLLVFSQVYVRWISDFVTIESTAAVLSQTSRVPHLISFLGAGIYEELMFRLLLLSGLVYLCRECGAGITSALMFAVSVTSIFCRSALPTVFRRRTRF